MKALSLILLLVPFGTLYGQYPSASHTYGTFSNLYSGMGHPSLTLNGFQAPPSKGNSLKEIINQVQDYQSILLEFDSEYGSEFQVKDPVEAVSPLKRVQDNVSALEKQAFMALLTFALEGYEQVDDHGFEKFQDILLNFKPNLTTTKDWYVVTKSTQRSPDYVKWTSSMMSYARAVDLYLGLERKCNC